MGVGIVPRRGVVEIRSVARLGVFDFDAAAGAFDAFQTQILSTPAGELHGSGRKGRESERCRLAFLVVRELLLEAHLGFCDSKTI